MFSNLPPKKKGKQFALQDFGENAVGPLSFVVFTAFTIILTFPEHVWQATEAPDCSSSLGHREGSAKGEQTATNDGGDDHGSGGDRFGRPERAGRDRASGGEQ